MKYKVNLNGIRISRRQLIADLKRVSAVAKTKVLSQKKYERYGKYSVASYHYRFGGWISALQLAGLNSAYLATPSNKELFNNLKYIWRKLRRQPTFEIMKTPISRYPGHVYSRAFGKWSRALEMFD